MNKIEQAEWLVYIIQTKSGKLYTGITNDMQRRMIAHKTNQGAKFFHISAPEKLLYQEGHINRSEASKRESAIKKLSRKEKLALTEELTAND